MKSLKVLFVVQTLAVFLLACDKGPSQGAPGAAKKPSVKISKQLRAQLESQQEILSIGVEIADLLTSVTTGQAPASAVQPRLAQLIPMLEEANNRGTKVLVATMASSQAKREMMRLSIQRTDEDVEWAKNVHAEFGIDPDSRPPNILDALKEAARSPNAKPINGELVRLRDVFLRGKAPLAPDNVRQRVARDLGPAGSPLKTQ